ncbi:MAG: nitroreductase family protein [Christensenellales bacterium]|jgi:nitroreductase
MTFLELATQRYSMRSFSSKKVEKEKIDLLLEAARVAPTACNYQPQRILVIQSDEGLEKLKGCTKYHFDAPAAILVCYDENESWKRNDFDEKEGGDIDASIIATQIMLQAAELGLGTTWVGNFNPAAIREAYHIPAHYHPVCLFPLGYPSETAKPSRKHTDRKPIEDTVRYETF